MAKMAALSGIPGCAVGRVAALGLVASSVRPGALGHRKETSGGDTALGAAWGSRGGHRCFYGSWPCWLEPAPLGWPGPGRFPAAVLDPVSAPLWAQVADEPSSGCWEMVEEEKGGPPLLPLGLSAERRPGGGGAALDAAKRRRSPEIVLTASMPTQALAPLAGAGALGLAWTGELSGHILGTGLARRVLGGGLAMEGRPRRCP
ncbi:hypothetical protein NDU88_002389 [Pleurodeles waltl]|uniref:Uncharacterized protein n=1 Tax=Pleurodeles waltl TaxID=8319 RepID=A0AAV7VDK6_PLEWA|nr:hypothetical protein NDU88_002389 [Pleurodeles waltl]